MLMKLIWRRNTSRT